VNRLKVLAVLLVLAAAFAIIAYAVNDWRIRNVGVVKAVGVGVYWDSACTVPVTEIQWGNMSLGEAKNTMVYVRNNGNVNITLSINTTAWNPPEAADYLTLSWDWNPAAVLKPGEVAPLTFTLTKDLRIPAFQDFSFEIWVAGVSV